LGIFAATYDQQARVDAQLTLGADVVATAPPGAVARDGLVRRVAALPATARVSAVDHAYAYVRPDLHATLGIHPRTLPPALSVRGSYFDCGDASRIGEGVRTLRGGIVVSNETFGDYSLNLGVLLRLRVLDHTTGRFRVAPFHVVGSVQEFPSAPRDSFMVTN